MRADARVLIVGPDAFREAVGRALPECRGVAAEHALSGVWQVGHQPFDAVVISLAASRNALRAVRSMREVAPDARIVVSCPPSDEPKAQRALQQGADDYVIEPVIRDDLARALDVPLPPRDLVGPPPVAPTLQEKTHFVEVLKNLGEGPRGALERMAHVLQAALDATYVAIRFDDLTVAVGAPDEPVLQEPVRSRDTNVGAVTVGRRRSGTYGALAAARLAEYARLVEAVVSVAREQARWQDLAWTDDLSQLRNRRFFEKRLDELIEQCARERAQLTVLLFDIDNFKEYNDRLGHETGDAVIREVSYLLTRCTRQSDVVSRFGGDEFAVIFWDAEQARVPGSKHPTEPAELTERFCEALRSHTFHCLGTDAPGPVTISGGLASFPWDARTRTELMRAADEALLEAKRTGKNRIQLARSDDDASPKADEASPESDASGSDD